MKFERYRDKSLLLQGALETVKAWDPDMSKPTSERNRLLLAAKYASGASDGDEGRSQHCFSFQYRTFKSTKESYRGHSALCFPPWIEEKASSGDIDDALSINIAPLEFNYIRERSSELADYLNNGLPGAYLQFFAFFR